MLNFLFCSSIFSGNRDGVSWESYHRLQVNIYRTRIHKFFKTVMHRICWIFKEHWTENDVQYFSSPSTNEYNLNFIHRTLNYSPLKWFKIIHYQSYVVKFSFQIKSLNMYHLSIPTLDYKCNENFLVQCIAVNKFPANFNWI